MRRLEGDTERTITADELCNRVVPLQQAKRLADTDEWPAVKPGRTAQREASQVVIAAVMMTFALVMGYVICYLQHFAAGVTR